MTPVAVSIQPKIDAAATMNITVAVVSTVSRQTLMNIFQLIVRYQTRPRNMAQTLAAMAPSVGVNRPVVMPPISSTGVMIGSTAWKRKMRSAANSGDDGAEDHGLRVQAGQVDQGPDRPAARRSRRRVSIMRATEAAATRT